MATLSASSIRNTLKLANSAMAKGKGQETLHYCQEILRIQPDNVNALFLMGKVLFAAGEYSHAEALLRRVIALEPDNVSCHLILSRVLSVSGNVNEAVDIAHKATRIVPHNPDTHGALVYLFMNHNHAHLVPAYLEEVMPQLKENVELLQFYAIALKFNERVEEADGVYQDIMKRYRIPSSFQVMYETYMPRLLISQDDIDKRRTTFEASLDRFIKEKPSIEAHMLSMLPLFALAYHHRDNKQLMIKYRQLLRNCIPELNYIAPHCKTVRPSGNKKPIRIGFASRHMHDHPVGRCYRNWIIALHGHNDFKIVLFVIENQIDEKIRELQAIGVEVLPVPKNFSYAQKMIAGQQLDILIYPDIGMDATTHYLALARLAHYQCCLLGHPDTTGIDTIDYYISSRLYEAEGAQENYTETLLLNDGVDTLFTRPKAPEKWYTRQELELPEDKKLYVCPMAIQKMHPDFDDILSQILAKDDKAVLVLFNDYQLQSASNKMQERILSKCPKERVIFLSWQPMDKLWSILKMADAVLVTIYFGAGTTAQFAFSYGIPMVTMPDNYVRSRVVYSYYKLMEIDDAPVGHTPEEYVSAAVRLANDAGYKEKISQQLLERNKRLFEESGYEEKLVKLMHDIMDQNLEAYRP